MSIRIKKRYGAKVHPDFTIEQLEHAVEYFQQVLKIESDVLITLKKKGDDIYDGSRIAYCFHNQNTDSISIHCFVHNRSSLVPQILILCHELCHAQQLDSGDYDEKTMEEEADKRSLEICCEYFALNDHLYSPGNLVLSLTITREFVN